jgi:hypothetical protein
MWWQSISTNVIKKVLLLKTIGTEARWPASNPLDERIVSNWNRFYVYWKVKKAITVMTTARHHPHHRNGSTSCCVQKWTKMCATSWTFFKCHIKCNDKTGSKMHRKRVRMCIFQSLIPDLRMYRMKVSLSIYYIVVRFYNKNNVE